MLGISSTSSKQEIKVRYRQLANQWHPDKNAGCPHAAAKFQFIAHAKSILLDDSKRAEYDRKLNQTASKERLFRSKVYASTGTVKMRSVIKNAKNTAAVNIYKSTSADDSDDEFRAVV